MATFSLENFRAEVLARGLAKANRFEVVVLSPQCVRNSNDSRVVSMMAENAQLPMARVSTSTQRIFGPPTQHPQFAEYGGDNMSLQFYLDREMRVKNFFDTWINGVVDPRTGTPFYQTNYLSTGMTITQLDEKDQIMYGVKFYDLYPIAVNPVQLDHNQANSISRLNVTFTYRRWETLSQAQAASSAPELQPRRNQTVETQRNPPNKRTGNVTYTGAYDPGTTTQDMAFGVGQLSG